MVAHRDTNVKGSEVPPISTAEGRTEWANARRLVELHGSDIRYCGNLGRWLRFDGKRWEIDRGASVETLTRSVIEAVWKQLVNLAKKGDNAALGPVFTFARATASARGQEAMLRMARREPDILIDAATLDTDPWLLNVENGTLDLRTGELRPHRREEFITKLCPVRYTRGANCPTWQRFLVEVLANSRDLIEFVRRAVGMSLTGKILDHLLLVLYGTGRNGKSTFLNTIERIIGPDYAMKAPPELLMARRGEAHPTERADLFGRRFVSCIEVEDGSRMAESLVKELTGGDAIRARFVKENFFEFPPTHHLWLATNHKPTIRGTDEGVWRRIKLVPFTVMIPEEHQDRELPDKLWAEREGILAWAVQGTMDWHKRGLGEPQEVRRATAQYRSEQDVVASFIEECCSTGDDRKVKAADLYAAYLDWCSKSGESTQTKRRFGLMMTERGFDRTTSNGTWYKGVGLLANAV